MVQKRIIKLSSLLFCFGLQLANAAPEEVAVERGEKPKVPFALRPEFMATNSTQGTADKKWVTLITTFGLEETFLKAIKFDFQTGSSASEPATFIVVNEKNIESGKNAKGEPETGTKARIELTLVSLMPRAQRVPSGEIITKANMLNFSISADKPLKVEIRNDHVAKIEKWTDPGNYFFREKDTGDLPALRVSNILPFKKSDNANKNMSSEDIRNLFKSE